MPGSARPRPRVRRAATAVLAGLALSLSSAAAGFLGGMYAHSTAPVEEVVVRAQARSGLDVSRIAKEASPSIVTIETGDGMGTGFVVERGDGELFVVTNAHVIGGYEQVTVVTSTGDELDGDVLGRNPEVDLAVVRAVGLDAPPLQLLDGAPEVGSDVVVIGNALGFGGTHSVTSGIVSAVGRDLTAPDGTHLEGLLQTDAAVNPGNSGGPLLDRRGRVVGVATAKVDPAVATNVAFAIPADVVAGILGTLSEGTRLGVVVEPADPGARVTRIAPGSAAEQAGIRPGDVIVAFDGEGIADPSSLVAAVSERSPGDVATVRLHRGENVLEVAVTLRSR